MCTVDRIRSVNTRTRRVCGSLLPWAVLILPLQLFLRMALTLARLAGPKSRPAYFGFAA